QVLIRRELGIKADLLRREAHEAAYVPDVAAQAGAENPRVTGGWREQGRQHRERGRLPGAVRPQQPQGLSLPDVEAYPANSLDVPERPPEVVKDHGRRLTQTRRVHPRPLQEGNSHGLPAAADWCFPRTFALGGSPFAAGTPVPDANIANAVVV